MQRLPYHMLWQPRELCRAAARPQNLRFYLAGLSHRMRRGDWPHETSITFSQMARTAHRPMAAGAAGTKFRNCLQTPRLCWIHRFRSALRIRRTMSINGSPMKRLCVLYARLVRSEFCSAQTVHGQTRRQNCGTSAHYPSRIKKKPPSSVRWDATLISAGST